MLHVRMFFALGGACVADVGADCAERMGVFAAEAHQFHRSAANGGAFQVEFDAVGKHFHVLFCQTSGGAMAASRCAFDAGFDAALKFLV